MKPSSGAAPYNKERDQHKYSPEEPRHDDAIVGAWEVLLEDFEVLLALRTTRGVNFPFPWHFGILVPQMRVNDYRSWSETKTNQIKTKRAVPTVNGHLQRTYRNHAELQESVSAPVEISLCCFHKRDKVCGP